MEQQAAHPRVQARLQVAAEVIHQVIQEAVITLLHHTVEEEAQVGEVLVVAAEAVAVAAAVEVTPVVVEVQAEPDRFVYSTII